MRTMKRTDRTRGRRAGVGEVLLRQLPGHSAVHGMWAGTKLGCLLVLTLVAVLCPGWPAALAAVAVAAGAAAAARVPAGAVPRLPLWTLALLVFGAVASALGHGVGAYLQSLLIAAGLTVLGAVVTWTTPLEAIASAVAALTAPLRRVGLPVGEWSLILTLCLRSLPLLVEEFRVLLAARQLRRGNRPGAPLRVLSHGLVDLLTAATAAAVRRANELGQAITVRGGVKAPAAGVPRLTRADAMALTVTVLASAVITGTTLAAGGR